LSTGYHSGSVTRTNVTVNYQAENNLPAVTLYGMVQVNICIMAGDSGGSVFDNHKAWGIVSGASTTASGGCLSPPVGYVNDFRTLDPNLQARIQTSS